MWLVRVARRMTLTNLVVHQAALLVATDPAYGALGSWALARDVSSVTVGREVPRLQQA